MVNNAPFGILIQVVFITLSVGGAMQGEDITVAEMSKNYCIHKFNSSL